MAGTTPVPHSRLRHGSPCRPGRPRHRTRPDRLTQDEIGSADTGHSQGRGTEGLVGESLPPGRHRSRRHTPFCGERPATPPETAAIGPLRQGRAAQQSWRRRRSCGLHRQARPLVCGMSITCYARSTSFAARICCASARGQHATAICCCGSPTRRGRGASRGGARPDDRPPHIAQSRAGKAGRAELRSLAAAAVSHGLE